MLGLLAGAPLAGLVSPRLLAQDAVGKFAPAAHPYRLARRVERQLQGGARLTVERRWSLKFAVQGRGYLVDGHQTGVTVDAPPALAFLAQMERDRLENDMFPLMLDAAGQILSATSSRADEALSTAVEQVRKRLEAAFGDGSDMAERFLAELQQAGEQSLAAWPANMLAPGAFDREEHRTVPLPDGRNGSITVRTLASSDPATGLMERFERQVTSRLGDSLREGLERLSLSPET